MYLRLWITGRRVLIGWIGGGSPASQSLARDLSLSADYELLQAFVPELQVLRKPSTYEQHEVTSTADGQKVTSGNAPVCDAHTHTPV